MDTSLTPNGDQNLAGPQGDSVGEDDETLGALVGHQGQTTGAACVPAGF